MVEKPQIMFQIKALHERIMQEILQDNALDKEPVPRPTQIKIMKYMLEHEDEVIYQRELEDFLNLSRATVSDVLKTMEKYGLIKREVDTEDTRIKRIFLQEKAKEIFKKNVTKMERLNDVMIEGFSSEEIEMFNNMMKRLIKNIDEDLERKR